MRALLYLMPFGALAAGVAAVVAGIAALRVRVPTAVRRPTSEPSARFRSRRGRLGREVRFQREADAEFRLLQKEHEIRREQRIVELEEEVEELRARNADLLRRSRHYISRSEATVRHGAA